MDQGNRHTLEMEEAMARNVFSRLQHTIWGKQKPHWFVRLNYHLCSFLATCALIWHLISYFILKFPEILKQHKHVDVAAIVQLRGLELGFSETEFYDKLIDFSLYSSLLWIVFLAGLILLWRGIKAYVYVTLGLGVIYLAMMLSLLGGTYFIEDTTTFDKVSLAFILVITLIQHFVFNKTFPPKSDFISKDEFE